MLINRFFSHKAMPSPAPTRKRERETEVEIPLEREKEKEIPGSNILPVIERDPSKPCTIPDADPKKKYPTCFA